MALATRCPNCNALFRVAAEQLRSRGGMVRCGSCRRVFNAIAGLDYLDSERQSAEDTGPRNSTPPPAPAVSGPAPIASPAARAAPSTLPPISAEASAARLPQATRQESAHDFAHESAQEPTQDPPARSGAPRVPAAAAPPVERRRIPRPEGTLRAAAGSVPAAAEPGIAALAALSVAARHHEPSAESQGPSFDTLFIVPKGAGDDGADESAVPGEDDVQGEPSFLRAQDGVPNRAVRAALVAGCALLLPLLLVQLALIARAPLLVGFPGLRPALQALCAPLSCTASWPMRPELLAVVSSELQSVPGTDALELDTVLRNRAAFPLALPAIELTISDSIGHAVARKVFLPADYFGSDGAANLAAGNIAAGADLAVRITFSLPGVSAAGFEAYPFYP